MKTILRGIFAVFTLIFAAAIFAVEDASARGAFLHISGNNLSFVVADYDNAPAANAAVMHACQSAGAGTCTGEIRNFRNRIIAFGILDFSGEHTTFFGFGSNKNAAINALIGQCNAKFNSVSGGSAACQKNFRADRNYKICGDGSAFVSPNQCDAIAPACEDGQKVDIPANACQGCPDGQRAFNNICETPLTNCPGNQILEMETNRCACMGDRKINASTNMCELNCLENELPFGDYCDDKMTCRDGKIINEETNTCVLVRNSGGGGSSSGAGIAVGGVAIVGFAALVFWDGSPDAFTFSPNAGFSATESGYAFNAGGRLDFRQDAWHLYWKTGGVNNNGNFGKLQYGTGGSYTGDFWTAAFSETVRGKKADYNISLAADYRNGLWNISPIYRLHARYEEGETETENALNLEAAYKRNGWILRPSAGFHWETQKDFGDNVRFGIKAAKQF